MHAVMPSVRFYSAKSAVQQIQPESDTETFALTLAHWASLLRFNTN
jgi:hypothetical protein